MAKKENALAHTKWMCKYHIVFTPKYRRKIIYNQYKADILEFPQNYPHKTNLLRLLSTTFKKCPKYKESCSFLM